jgi:diguanylate cyclase (GGDEF)-like protein
MDQGQASHNSTQRSKFLCPEEPISRNCESLAWPVSSTNRLLDAQIREGIGHNLFGGIDRNLDELLREIEVSSVDREVNAERLRGIRTLLVKAAHSVAVQAEILSELRLLALTDELTGLYNRRGFLILGMQQLKISRRNGLPLLLFFADVDHLKLANDVHGHDEGDALLLRCAAVLNNTFREADIVARLGGDEFAVLAQEGDDSTCEIIRRRLDTSLREVNARGGLTPLSLSVGISRFDPQLPVTLTELLTVADRDMYQQKRVRHPAWTSTELSSSTD